MPLCFSCEKTEEANVSLSRKSGEIGAFSLVSPTDGAEFTQVPEFVWQEAPGADSYTLEICSSENYSQAEDKVYVKKTGIVSTAYRLGANLKDKNEFYYWKVTAVNADRSRVCENGGRFYYKAETSEEIEIDLSFADEWSVHELGSEATVSVDNSDFFGNGKPSLTVSFVEENTNKGPGNEESDGWIVITNPKEFEMYGVDAFYFNFYYSGNDAEVFIRVIDDDNEYWNAPVKLANNAKQTVIIRFDDFTLRTKGGTTIANRVFDYNHIKGVEFVYEKSFGDGVTYISDLKAVRFDNYGHLFIDKLDFSQTDESSYTFDSYRFSTAVSEDGREFTYSYPNAAGDRINGYGFVRVPINKLLADGDSFSFGLSYEGSEANNATILIRLIEEDGDRWVYRQKVKELPPEGRLVVPFAAFTLSEYRGDGSRQFYYIQQFQYGIEGVYGRGTVKVSDFGVCSLAHSGIENLYVGTLSPDGTIDSFNDYANSVNMYYVWQNSLSNKDESMTLDSVNSYGRNNVCAKFTYKSDMGPATYGVMFEGREGFNALKFWAMDKSVKSSGAAYVNSGSANATLIIALYLSSGEEYRYVINGLSSEWTSYVVSFEDFTYASTGFFAESLPLASENVAGVAFGLQYYYYGSYLSGQAVPYPAYTPSNAVYFDNIMLTSADESSSGDVGEKLMPDENDPNMCPVDDFDSLTAATLPYVIAGTDDYSSLALSEDTASGNGQSLKLGYKGNSPSVSYARELDFDASVSAKAVRFKLKGDGKATVYINIFFVHAGSTYKYRVTLSNVSDEWCEYVIGFDNFEKVEGTGSVVLSKTVVPEITEMTIGVTNGADGEISYVYFDDLAFDGNVGYKTFTVTETGGEE